jgi:hypothetical protein
MHRPTLNFIIDIALFIITMAIAGIGLLLKYVLITGQEQWVRYGRRVELSFLGLDRHGWGDIHFYLALLMLGVLILHIYFHWRMIVLLYRRLIGSPRVRLIALIIFVLVCFILIAFPFLISPEVNLPGA